MFSSFRRHYLDLFLSRADFSGDVLDVGGKNENRKGSFRPPLERCRSWRTVNIDPKASPDFLASADALPNPNSSADHVLLAETLEHLAFPEKALAEAFRVLRPGGTLILTMPFLYPLHGDPEDYQRWTPEKFRRVLLSLGFEAIEVLPMGGLWAVIHDVFEAYCQYHYVLNLRLALPLRAIRKVFRFGGMRNFFLALDSRLVAKESICTGYFVKARKRI